MKLSLLAFTAVVAGATANLDGTRASRRLNKEFMHAMHANPRIPEANKKNRAQKIQKLHENLMKSSRKLDQQNNQYSQYQQQAYSDYNGQQQYSEQYNNGQGDNQGDNQYQQSYQEGQAYNDTGTWNGQYWEFNGEVPFDLTSRAFKYSGCAAIKTYDEERAYENGNPMVMDTYAVFRLCPASKCNKYSLTGCGKNYGEYAVEMKTYLSYVLGFYDERYQDYCSYCEPCDYEYQAEAKTDLQMCYATVQQQGYQYSQQQQQQAWQNYYNANNGDMSGWNVNGGGDQNFQNYNQAYNQAQASGNGYYNNERNGSGANYQANSSGGSNGASSANSAGTYYNGANNYRNGGYGNRKLEEDADADSGYDTTQGYWGADGVYYPYQNLNQEGMYEQCMDGSLCDECQYQNEQQYLWCDDYTCGDYYTYCSDLYGELDDFDVSQFLECTEYENDYGQAYYIGPHCGSDHYTISLGVYSDENCLEYIGEDISLSTVLGFNYDDADLFKLPKECISCDGAEDYEENYVDQGDGRYGDYVTAPETDQEGVVAVCRALYEGSAQCNMNMNNFESISQYMSDYELAVEQRTCSFIENIIYGAYDESGDILLKPESFDFADWQNPQQYKKLRMPADQAVFLSLSIIAFIATAAAAVFTHRSMTRTSSPWRPKRMSSEELKRQPSGIGMARSRSGPTNAPLI